MGGGGGGNITSIFILFEAYFPGIPILNIQTLPALPA